MPKLSWLHCTVQLGSRCDCADTTMTYRAAFLEQTAKQSNQAPNYISKIKFRKLIRCNPDVNVIKLNSKNKINGCNHPRADGIDKLRKHRERHRADCLKMGNNNSSDRAYSCGHIGTFRGSTHAELSSHTPTRQAGDRLLISLGSVATTPDPILLRKSCDTMGPVTVMPGWSPMHAQEVSQDA